MTDRRVIEVTGADRLRFLQGLVTNDVGALDRGLVYAALLSPQGKYLADFLLVPRDEAVLLDVAAPVAEALLRRLSMYRLRSGVSLALADVAVARGLGEPPEGALPDPRHPALGWRRYGAPADPAPAGGPAPVDWDALRVEHVVPETGIELIPEETYVLEAGFERLHGVDFRKGCYVGQEVTARMKHKTELRKGLARVAVHGEAAPGEAIVTEDGREAGRLHTRAGGAAIAFLRFDRAGGPLLAGGAEIRRLDG